MRWFWGSDFSFEGGRVRIHKTGIVIPLDGALIAEALVWLVYYVPVRLKAAWMRLTRPGPDVWFAPDSPRPWYLAWASAAWAGARIVRRPEGAAAGFYFDDSARGVAPNAGPARRINWRCTDVTKSRVAAAFEESFGYGLAVDPTTAVGPLVEKGEDNGVHDGRIVEAPCPALAGKSYQKLIDNTEGPLVADLRTPCVGGKPVVVFIKRRPIGVRFSNHNTRVTLHAPEAIFSPEEIATIGTFCGAMGLDWGGLDILRDKDGRLYVVDVNKTDMGPPISLPLRDKLKATGLLADAFLRLIHEDSGTGGGA